MMSLTVMARDQKCHNAIDRAPSRHRICNLSIDCNNGAAQCQWWAQPKYYNKSSTMYIYIIFKYLKVPSYEIGSGYA
jgi:hypothetical protein